MKDVITRRHFLGRCGRSLAICASSAVLPMLSTPRPARAAPIVKGLIGRKLSPYFTPLEDLMIRCTLCPHGCEVGPGERGLCKVRENIDGQYYSLVYANPCAVHIDPIEKKPFYHVLPTSRAFSISTANFVKTGKFLRYGRMTPIITDFHRTRSYRVRLITRVGQSLQHM